jgi:hypothetical protein
LLFALWTNRPSATTNGGVTGGQQPRVLLVEPVWIAD